MQFKSLQSFWWTRVTQNRDLTHSFYQNFKLIKPLCVYNCVQVNFIENRTVILSRKPGLAKQINSVVVVLCVFEV